MKLYELEWALYPRRIGIYIAEKGIKDITRIALDSSDNTVLERLKAINNLGTVPVLEVADGFRIRSSIAILEYLEERFPSPTMIGGSPQERALTRELMGIADEAAIHLGI